MARPKNYDCFGHCVISGLPLYEERAIDGVIQRVPKPNMTHATYLLADGSLMRVCISKEEKKKLKNTKAEYDFIMNKVKKGWEKETEQLVKDETKPEWDNKRAKEYLKEYSKKDISSRIDDIPFRTMSNIEKEVNKVKRKLIREARKGVK